MYTPRDCVYTRKYSRLYYTNTGCTHAVYKPNIQSMYTPRDCVYTRKYSRLYYTNIGCTHAEYKPNILTK